ncbi:hypothetical protein [Paenibacillus odorifer]|uniref:hypothetical protein n=1 Tax=Paenibacillus odorifer TaxID=189426 RepID=UPI00096F81B8|nr:hypothetical protein [Paenibacillus odorifer]OME19934.1 hypothetical protein BSK57_23485 [Paenibacillus odorifer]
MENSDLYAMIPMMIVLIFTMLYLHSLFFKGDRKLAFKLLRNILWISFTIIFIFSAFYLMVAVSDMQAISSGKYTQITIDMLSSFDVTKNVHYEGDFKFFLFDLFLYSVSVFFHTPFHFQIIGPGQVIVILESILGYILPLVVILLTYKKDKNSQKEQIEVLRIYLNRGWNIYRVRDGVIKGIKVVEIVSSDYLDNEMLYVSKSIILDELIEGFTVKWGKATSLNVLPYYARYLEQFLVNENYELSFNATHFFHSKYKMDDQYKSQFYSFLLEIGQLKNSFHYNESATHIKKLLKDYLGGEINNQNDDSIDEVLIIEVESDE